MIVASHDTNAGRFPEKGNRMKKEIFAIVAAALVSIGFGASLFGADNADVPETVSTSDGRVLNLTWHDEFYGEGLPDETQWSYEVGFVRNSEEQYYTKGRLENIFQKDGFLTIRTLKEEYDLTGKPNAKGRAKAEYTSAAIETLGKASWQYGRVEVRAKLPKGKGIWPAIWMKGANNNQVGWPRCGEIDIMEYVGHKPRTTHGTIHMQRKDATRGKVVSRTGMIKFEDGPEKPEESFHVYALEWTKDYLKIFVDDQLELDFQRAEEEPKAESWPFDQPCFMILNTAIGGSWGGSIGADTCPAEFVIDYVRVYQ